MYKPEIITETQKHEIESLIGEHEGALKAFGADCYRAGMHKTIVNGVIILTIAYAIGVGAGLLVTKIRNKKDHE